MKKLTTFIIIFTLLLPFVPAHAFASPKTLDIRSADDLIAFAKRCTDSSYSVGMTVNLTVDIDLTESDFSPIPSFSGTFNGNHHTISGLNISPNGSQTGLFRYIEKEGTVRNLRVNGMISPLSSRCFVGGIAGVNRGSIVRCAFQGRLSGEENIGGIAGINEKSGLISDCTAEGAIQGELRTGGIAGENKGVILSCTNHASVDTSVSESKLSLENFDLENIREEEITSTTDAGGIAGLSSGIIQTCENYGSIGYPHIGYNIGGIVGRQNGSLYHCTNSGSVFGRKDVGGIAGQLEPYCSIDMEEGTLNQLLAEMEILNKQNDRLISDVRAASLNLNSDIQNITSRLNAVNDSAQALYTCAEDIFNGTVGGINELAVRTRIALDGCAPALEELQNGLKYLKELCDTLEEKLNKAPDSETAQNTALVQTELSKMQVSAANIEQSLLAISQSEQIIADFPDDSETVENTLAAILDSLDNITKEMEDLSDSLAEIEKLLREFEENFSDVDFKEISDNLSVLKDCTAEIAKAAGKISDSFLNAFGYLSDTVSTLAQKQAIEFPAADEKFTENVDTLFRNFKELNAAISKIGTSTELQSGQILDDVAAINAEMNKIFDILTELYEKTIGTDEENPVISDISESDAEDSSSPFINGKTSLCQNNGTIEGDVNVGGITGSMAIDYDFDPEDDNFSIGTHSYSFSYKFRDIVENCNNCGEVTAKKNYCGGIVGRMDMGVVRNCSQNGALTSTGGNYVGGIAGFSTAAIRSCTATVCLSGIAYLGGIAGNGRILTDNAALVDVIKSTECAGAIAGYADFSENHTDISGNLFVDRGLGGIDFISYPKIAEPCAYDEFYRRAGESAQIYLTFVADNKILSTVPVDYGKGLNDSLIPKIPEKDGYFARWEDCDFDCITFSKTVHAEYLKFTTVIESNQKNENGLPLVLAEGIYDDTATLDIWTQKETIVPPSDHYMLRIVHISAENHADMLRFLKPDGKGKISVKCLINDAWTDVPFTENGRYVLVNCDSSHGQDMIYCIGRTTQNPPVILIIVISGILLALLVVFGIVLARTHKHSKRNK